jgi:hypothetical protein
VKKNVFRKSWEFLVVSKNFIPVSKIDYSKKF